MKQRCVNTSGSETAQWYPNPAEPDLEWTESSYAGLDLKAQFVDQL